MVVTVSAIFDRDDHIFLLNILEFTKVPKTLMLSRLILNLLVLLPQFFERVQLFDLNVIERKPCI